jgi:polysaccharide export outer membrane protein
MIRILLSAAVAAIFLSSCVTNKKYVYLQNDDVNKRDLPLDTIVRKYQLIGFDYKVQPEDLINVEFESLTPQEFDFLNQDRSQTQNTNVTQANALLFGDLVDQKGEIPFPFLGKVKVQGLTIFEVQEKLQGIASQYLESPVVKVRLLNYRFTILGEVKNEGTITLANNRISIIEALGLAGGLTDLADKSIIKIIRTRDGQSSIAYINLLDEDLLTSPFYYVYQNDMIIVPALRQRPYQTYFGKNLALMISSLSLLLLTISLINNN